jgi:hypothetical protein
MQLRHRKHPMLRRLIFHHRQNSNSFLHKTRLPKDVFVEIYILTLARYLRDEWSQTASDFKKTYLANNRIIIDRDTFPWTHVEVYKDPTPLINERCAEEAKYLRNCVFD